MNICLTVIASVAGFFSLYPEGEQPWWKEAITACVLEEEGDRAGSVAAWGRALAAEAPEPFVLYELGLGMAALDDPGAVETFERATLVPESRAHAWFQIARIRGAQAETEACRAALLASAQAGLTLGRGVMKRDSAFASVRSEKWFRELLRWVEDPSERYERLLESGSHEELVDFFRALGFGQPDDEATPPWLIVGTLEALLAEAAKGRERDGELRERLLAVGRAADEGLLTDAFSTWLAVVVDLNEEQARDFLSNWKSIRGCGPLFRSHKFKTLMKRFEPIAKSAKEMGDLYGLLCVQMILSRTRVCLCEYRVGGYNLDREWRKGWEDMDFIELYAAAFGERYESASSHELRVAYLGNLTSEAIKNEFLTSKNIFEAYIGMTFFERFLPPEDRQISWSAKAIRRHKIID